MLDLAFQNSTASEGYNSKFFEKTLLTSIRALKISKRNIGISVNVVGGAKIRELNRKYRHKNKVTDVLSFPMQENGYSETRDKKQVRSKELVSGHLSSVADLGDIFICLPFAKKEAKRENIGIERKLAQLTVHGFLHLMGYDHERSREDEERMLSLEDKISKELRY